MTDAVQSDSSFWGDLGTAFTGGLREAIPVLADNLSGTRNKVSDPAVQYQRNPNTGELYNTATGNKVSNTSPGGLPTWAMVGAGVAVLGLVAFLALRR